MENLKVKKLEVYKREIKEYYNLIEKIKNYRHLSEFLIGNKFLYRAIKYIKEEPKGFDSLEKYDKAEL